jgi:glycosyltransferase involved in cell wall biosynthesis
MNPDVSVIIPTHNRHAFVFAAIASVIAQRDTKFELIVVDDGSADATWQELERISARANFDNAAYMTMRVTRIENSGVAAARNAGSAMATAPLIAFLDSDDLWNSRKLARQVDFMQSNPACAISQTNEVWLRDLKRVNPGVRHRKRSGDIFIDSLRTCLISPSAVIMRTELFRELGGFDRDMAAAEDYDLWLRILVNHEVALLDELLVTRRAGHAGQLSAMVPAIDRFRILALLKLLGHNDLSMERRAAVCDVLAAKCAIYAKGLTRRGYLNRASLILDAAANANGPWREGANHRLADMAAAIRALIRRRTAAMHLV